MPAGRTLDPGLDPEGQGYGIEGGGEVHEGGLNSGNNNTVEASTVALGIERASGEEAEGVRNAGDVARGLAQSLYTFGGIIFYVVCIQLMFVVFLLLGVPTSEPTGNYNKRQFGLVSKFARILMDGVLGSLTIVTAHHMGRVVAAGAQAGEETRSHLERVLLCLSAIFNTLALAMGLNMLVDIPSTVLAYPDMLIVIAYSLLAITLFWLSGFLVLRIWRVRHHPSAVGVLLTAPLEEVQKVNIYIRFWLIQVFGRFEVQQTGTALSMEQDLQANVKDPRHSYKLELENTAFKNITFTSAQRHVVRLLPEAMNHSVQWLCYRLYSILLQVAVYVLGKDWMLSVSTLLELLKVSIAIYLILQGARLFSLAMENDSATPKIRKIVRGFGALQQTFRRLSIMYFVTSTVQMVTGILAAVP